MENPENAIDRSSYIPLHAQVRHRILKAIAKHPDRSQPVLTDDELANKLGVARGTVRQAIRGLVEEGILQRVRGVGTFIAPPKLNHSLDQVGSWAQDWPSEGRSLRTEILLTEERPCPPWAARLLGLPEEGLAVYFKRRRWVDDVPFSLEDVYVVLEVGRCLTREELEAEPMVHLIAERKLGLSFSGSRVEIEATVARPSEAASLQIEVGSPLFLRRWTLLTDKSLAILAAKALQRGDLYKYSVCIPLAPHRLPQSASDTNTVD